MITFLILIFHCHRNDLVQTYQHLGPVYCVDAHPSCPSVIAAATDDGSIYLIDTRAPASRLMVVARTVDVDRVSISILVQTLLKSRCWFSLKRNFRLIIMHNELYCPCM